MKSILIVLMMMFTIPSIANEQVGEIYLGGLIQRQYIKVYVFDDPDIPGVSCHVSTIYKSLSWSDPSNMSIACRQVNKINVDVANLKHEVNVFRASKSILFKEMKVKRFYDKKRNVLIYVAYSEKTFDGSHKNSISTISLNKF